LSNPLVDNLEKVLMQASRGAIRADVGHDKLVGEEQEDREAVRARLGKNSGWPTLSTASAWIIRVGSARTEPTYGKRESTMTSLAHRGFVHLGMDVSRDSISVAVLHPDRDTAELDKISADEPSVRRLFKRLGRPSDCGPAMRPARPAMTCTGC